MSATDDEGSAVPEGGLELPALPANVLQAIANAMDPGDTLNCRLVCKGWASMFASVVAHVTLPIFPALFQPLPAAPASFDGITSLTLELHAPPSHATPAATGPSASAVSPLAASAIQAVLQSAAASHPCVKQLHVCSPVLTSASLELPQPTKIKSGMMFSSSSQSSAGGVPMPAAAASARPMQQLCATPLPDATLPTLLEEPCIYRHLTHLKLSGQIIITGSYISSLASLRSLEQLCMKGLEYACVPLVSVLKQLAGLSVLPRLTHLDVPFRVLQDDTIADWCCVLDVLGGLTGLQHLGLHGALCHTPQLAAAARRLATRLTALTSLQLRMAECSHAHEDIEGLSYDDPDLMGPGVWRGVLASFSGLRALDLHMDQLPLQLWQEANCIGTLTTRGHVSTTRDHASTTPDHLNTTLDDGSAAHGHTVNGAAANDATNIVINGGSTNADDDAGHARGGGLASLAVDFSAWGIDYEPPLQGLSDTCTALSLRCSDWRTMYADLPTVPALRSLRITFQGFNFTSPDGNRSEYYDGGCGHEGDDEFVKWMAPGAFKGGWALTCLTSLELRGEGPMLNGGDLKVIARRLTQLQRFHYEGHLHNNVGRAMSLFLLTLACITELTILNQSSLIAWVESGSPVPRESRNKVRWDMLPRQLRRLRLSSFEFFVEAADNAVVEPRPALRSLVLERCFASVGGAQTGRSSSAKKPAHAPAQQQQQQSGIWPGKWWSTLAATAPGLEQLHLVGCHFMTASPATDAADAAAAARSPGSGAASSSSRGQNTEGQDRRGRAISSGFGQMMQELRLWGCRNIVPHCTNEAAALVLPLLSAAAASLLRAELDLVACLRCHDAQTAATAATNTSSKVMTDGSKSNCNDAPDGGSCGGLAAAVMDALAPATGLRSLRLAIPSSATAHLTRLAPLKRLAVIEVVCQLKGGAGGSGVQSSLMPGLAMQVNRERTLATLSAALPHCQVAYVQATGAVDGSSSA